MAAWAKITTTPAGTWQTVISQQGSKAAGFSLDYNPTAGRWAFDRATTDVAAPTLAGANSTAAPTLNTWTQLLGTYDAGTGKMTLYVNGVAQGTATDTTPIASTGALAIGRGYAAGAAAQYFNGSVSKAQVYNRVLTAPRRPRSTAPAAPPGPRRSPPPGRTTSAACPGPRPIRAATRPG